MIKLLRPLGSVLLALLCSANFAADELLLCDFEAPESMKVIEGRAKVEPVAEHATQGAKAGKVAAGFALVAGGWTGLPADWSGYDQLRLDVFNPGETGKVSLWISDGGGSDYWQRHNNQLPLRPGANTLSIPVGGMFRGEKGSGKFIDTKAIKQMVISFPKEAKDGFFLDNFRLAKGAGGQPAQTKLIFGFEQAGEAAAKWSLEDWPEDKPGKSVASVVEEHATEGKKALKLEFRAEGGALHVGSLADPDWSGYDSLEIDCFSLAAAPTKLSGWFRDEEAKPSDGDYWKRHNYQTNLKPGASTVRFPVGGFYRGEKGSGKFLDPKKMFAFCIGARGVIVFFDNFRLVKGGSEVAVEGLKAFDFGLPNSPTFPGFTAVHKDTSYNAQRGFGWLGNCPSDARNYEHPDSLLCDFVRCNGGETFALDVPDGEYVVWLMLDIIGYWDYPAWLKRSVEANGQAVVSENLTPEQFLKDRYFRHQDDEDLPGTDIWQKYVQTHFQPKVFKAKAEAGQLKLTFRGDTWGLTIPALVVFPVSAEDSGTKWLAQLDTRRREEYYTSFAEVVHKAEPKPEVTAEETAAGCVLFHRDLEEELWYNSAFGGHPSDTRELAINWAACPGEYESADLCIYPLKDCGELTLQASELNGPAGAKIPADALRTRVLAYKFRRIGGRITSAYEYRPATLNAVRSVAIPAGVTRRLWLTLKVPDAAAPGDYTGQLTVSMAGKTRQVPLKLTVYPFKLDEPKMPLAMYGGRGPTGGGYWPQELKTAFRLEARVEEVLRDQKEHGMTAVTPVAPSFKGIRDGKAQFEYQQADDFMALLRKLGYTHECFTYASMFRVQEGADKQDFAKLEREIKLAYEELGAHAKERNWLPVAWALADEPLIHGVSAETVIKIFEAHRKAAPQMQFVSEDAMGDPSHYVVIPAIDIVSGNTPRYKVAEAVKKAGRRYWFNNIGIDRVTFGWFMWKANKEMGVEALFQWGYSTNHADIYYDFDGFEGDSGVSFTASEGQRAKREWELIREGADDHRYLQTLANLIAKTEAGGDAAAKTKAAEAREFCNQVMSKIDLENKRKRAYTNGELDAQKRKLAQFIMTLQK